LEEVQEKRVLTGLWPVWQMKGIAMGAGKNRGKRDNCAEQVS
jgi:hypothetical protein